MYGVAVGNRMRDRSYSYTSVYCKLIDRLYFNPVFIFREYQLIFYFSFVSQHQISISTQYSR